VDTAAEPGVSAAASDNATVTATASDGAIDAATATITTADSGADFLEFEEDETSTEDKTGSMPSDATIGTKLTEKFRTVGVNVDRLGIFQELLAGVTTKMFTNLCNSGTQKSAWIDLDSPARGNALKSIFAEFKIPFGKAHKSAIAARQTRFCCTRKMIQSMEETVSFLLLATPGCDTDCAITRVMEKDLSTEVKEATQELVISQALRKSLCDLRAKFLHIGSILNEDCDAETMCAKIKPIVNQSGRLSEEALSSSAEALATQARRPFTVLSA
jgi:hypothetical protein